MKRNIIVTTPSEITWLTFLIQDIESPLPNPPILLCDNFSALYLTTKPIFMLELDM